MSAKLVSFSAGGMVRRAPKYAPAAMKAMCPNDMTPEFPLKSCQARTSIIQRNNLMMSSSKVTLPTYSTSAQVSTMTAERTSGVQATRR
jgi:hypothetical protein